MRFGGLHRNVALCLALECLWAIHFSVAITVEFYGQFGINVAAVLGMQALMGLVSTACDVPFGYLAVRIGVRRILLLGVVLQLIQSCLFAFWCRTVLQFSITLCLTGVAWALTYGTTKAMVLATDPEQITNYAARAVQVRSVGQLFGVLVGGFLAVHVSLSSPVMIQPIAFALALPVAFALKQKETIHSRLTHPKLSSILEIGKLMLITRTQVRWAVLLTASINASVLAMMWLAQPDMKAAGVTLDMFGYVYAVRTLATMVFAQFVNGFVERYNRFSTQVVLTTVVVACSAFAGLPSGPTGAVAILLANALATAVTDPLLTGVIKDHVPEAMTHGPTVYSVVSAVQSALFVVSPLMGWVTEHYSTDTALLCIACCTALFSGFCVYKYEQGTVL